MSNRVCASQRNKPQFIRLWNALLNNDWFSSSTVIYNTLWIGSAHKLLCSARQQHQYTIHKKNTLTESRTGVIIQYTHTYRDIHARIARFNIVVCASTTDTEYTKDMKINEHIDIAYRMDRHSHIHKMYSIFSYKHIKKQSNENDIHFSSLHNENIVYQYLISIYYDFVLKQQKKNQKNHFQTSFFFLSSWKMLRVFLRIKR